MVLGFEPPNFTCHFHGWNPAKWSGGKTYEELKRELESSNPSGDLGDMGPTCVVSALESFSNIVCTFEQLCSGGSLPDGVDPTKKEQYLTEADFQKHMGMSKADFNKLPAWKGNVLKKKVGLF